MPYPAILSRRIPYDINGTVVAISSSVTFQHGIAAWLSSAVVAEMNDENLVNVPTIPSSGAGIWFFLPERMEIEAGYIATMTDAASYPGTLYSIQGSNDTTNGLDGTWETAVFPSGTPHKENAMAPDWRTHTKPISFSTTYRVIRIHLMLSQISGKLRAMHLYGRKAMGETPHDILFVNLDGTEKTALKDWGDRPEGTTVIDSFKLKNASLTKIANAVNLQLNHGDMSLSFSEVGPWTATLDITSIAPNSLSSTIYVRHLLGPPQLILGPRAGRTIVTVGSWV